MTPSAVKCRSESVAGISESVQFIGRLRSHRGILRYDSKLLVTFKKMLWHWRRICKMIATDGVSESTSIKNI